MGSIPFGGIAALANETGQIGQAPMNALTEEARLRQMNTETSGLALQNQLQQQAIKDQGALTKALSQYDPSTMTPADMTRLVTQNGGSGKAALEAQAGMVNAKQNLLKLSDTEFARQQQQNDLLAGVHKQVTDAPQEQKQQVYSQGLQQLQQGGIDVSKEPQQYPGDQVFAQHLIPIQLMSKLQEQAGKERAMQVQGSEITANNAKAQADQAKAALDKANTFLAQNKADLIQQYKQNPNALLSQIDSIFPPNSAQNARYKYGVNQALSMGDVDGAKEWIKQASDEKSSLEKESYVQSSENIRQALNRQAMQSNELQKAGLNKLDQMFTDPQHGYTQFLAQANATQNAIASAKDGNELAASLAPLMTVLGVNSFAGVHRVSPQEYEAAGPQVGSIYRRINSMLDKAAAGKIQPDTAKEMTGLIDGLITSKHQSLVGSAQLVARNGGLDPTKTSVLDEKGNVTTLDKIQGASAQAGAQGGGIPAGATHKAMGSDHQWHYTNSQGQDLGVVK